MAASIKEAGEVFRASFEVPMVKVTRGRRVTTSTLQRVDWSGHWEYRGTLVTMVPVFGLNLEGKRKFDAYFGPHGLRVMEERSAR